MLEPPPEKPWEAGSPEAWREVQRLLRLTLPSDYVALISAYGAGMWYGGELVVCNPFTAEFGRNLVKQCGSNEGDDWSALEAERMMASELQAQGQTYPFPIYPAAGGIIPWAYTGNGGRIFWLSKGAPDEWPTIYFPDRSDEFRFLELSASQIIRGLLDGSFELYPGSERLSEDYLRQLNADSESPVRLGFTPIPAPCLA